jgi:YegS/Rv2252/BmrU family lipid kinase
MQPFVIINNTAAKARHAWPIVRAQLQKEKIRFESYLTARAGDATGRTREAIRQGQELIVVVGGDGTLSEVAEGFFAFDSVSKTPQPINTRATLAILPAGTGDDFARGLTNGRAPLDYWIGKLIGYCAGSPANVREVDLLAGASNDFQHRFICLNASTMGIGGETAARVAAQRQLVRRLSGEMRFMIAAIGALVVWRERRVRVTVDEKLVADSPMNLVAVANNRFAGGGMLLSPEARVDDGLLDVLTASGLSRLGVVRELPRIHSGGHLLNPKVNAFQGRHVVIETFATEDALPIEADGNLRGKTPVGFRVLPRALRVVV